MNRWTDADEKSLLLAVIHVLSPTAGPDWVRVAALMGPRYTASSTKQHYRKIRMESDRIFKNGTATSSSPSTPVGTAKCKGTAGRPKGSGASGKRKQGNGMSPTDGADDVDDDDPLLTANQGVKRADSPLAGKEKTAKRIKVEGDDGSIAALGLGGLVDDDDFWVWGKEFRGGSQGME